VRGAGTAVVDDGGEPREEPVVRDLADGEDRGACARQQPRRSRSAMTPGLPARARAWQAASRSDCNAKALYGLAETLHITQGATAAKIYWREALDIFRQLGVPQAALVELRLYGTSASAS
jgi:hypothetical protein